MINWEKFFSEIGLIALAVVMTNSLNILDKGFSWLGMGVLFCGLGFVIVIIILRNYTEDNKLRRGEMK